MGYGGLAIVGIIFCIIIAIFTGMLITGLAFVVTGVVKYVKNGRTFTAGSKKTLIIGICLAALPLLSLITTGISKVSESVNNSRDLYYQATSGTADGMRRILESGVSPDCKAFDRSMKLNAPAEGTETTILGYLVIYYNDNRNEREQYGEKIQLLIDYGADVNRRMGYLSMPDVIVTPLLMAVDGRNSDVTELLLKNGADVNARYQDGKTALEKLNSDIEYYGPDGYRYDEDFYNNLLSVRDVLLRYGAKR
ncbi:MAG: hypothetical protein NC299_11210 [Lachnospiraceae bacterium]|nr:hypothetical protein [Ruminococcus sp.]MCM1275915.1 hypothetical protein [Lachnospiraceae bacterium]